MKWRRYRFYVPFTEDHRPLIFNPRYPWWRSGFAEGFIVIVAYLPIEEDLLKYWPDAFNIDSTDEETITFSSRFAKPEYFVES